MTEAGEAGVLVLVASFDSHPGSWLAFLCQGSPRSYNAHFNGHSHEGRPAAGPLRDGGARPTKQRDGRRHLAQGAIMAEDKLEPREVSWRQLLPWTELFRGFQIALDLNKLLLAAAGIFVMAVGWWLLAVLFSTSRGDSPSWPGNFKSTGESKEEQAWSEFETARAHWAIMYEATGGKGVWNVYDLANSEQAPTPGRTHADLRGKPAAGLRGGPAIHRRLPRQAGHARHPAGRGSRRLHRPGHRRRGGLRQRMVGRDGLGHQGDLLVPRRRHREVHGGMHRSSRVRATSQR